MGEQEKMAQNTSPDYPLKRWHQQAAKHPGFIGYALSLLRERNAVTEEQQREVIGIPPQADYDPAWLHLQAMTFPRAGEDFKQDVERIAEYITRKVQEQHHLSVALNVWGLLELLVEARKEMALKLTSLQPFAVIIHGLGTLLATGTRSEYLVYLPEGVEEATIELNVAPSGGSDYVMEWARRIRACTDDEQAARLLTSFSLMLAEAMMNRAIDSMGDLLGVPRVTDE